MFKWLLRLLGIKERSPLLVLFDKYDGANPDHPHVNQYDVRDVAAAGEKSLMYLLNTYITKLFSDEYSYMAIPARTPTHLEYVFVVDGNPICYRLYYSDVPDMLTDLFKMSNPGHVVPNWINSLVVPDKIRLTNNLNYLAVVESTTFPMAPDSLLCFRIYPDFNLTKLEMLRIWPSGPEQRDQSRSIWVTKPDGTVTEYTVSGKIPLKDITDIIATVMELPQGSVSAYPPLTNLYTQK